MACYSVEGKLGAGKTKFCVWRIQQALREGLRVASNLDLDLTQLVPEKRTSYMRLPDKPTAEDLQLIGEGNPNSYDEDQNGLLVLDELATWLNARTFGDKGRSAVIDWLLHARKHGWDVYFIVQDAQMIDKQVRVLIDLETKCTQLSKVSIPFVGKLMRSVFGNKLRGKRVGYLPRMHSVTARQGQAPNQIIVERWFFVGRDLHTAYDTRQIFRDDYPHGTHTVIPPSTFQPKLSWFGRLSDWCSRAPEPKRVDRVEAAARPPRVHPPAAARRVIQLLYGLPLDQRWEHSKRLHRLGLL